MIFIQIRTNSAIPMKTLLIAIAAVFTLAGSVYAGCGKKVTDEGALSSYDAETKMIVVKAEDGEEAKLTITKDTVVKDSEGKEVALEDLVEKSVKVISEHKKVDSVEAKAS